MKLSEEQRARLEELSDESYVDVLPESQWEPRRQQLLSKISDAYELHVFAMNVNWDGGIKDLEWCVNHKHCDLATALMIYALGSPGFYYRKEEKGKLVSDHDMPTWKFLKSIESKVANHAFKESNIAFDPRDFHGDDYYAINSANPGNRLVPDFMKQQTQGEIIENPIF